MTKSNNSYMQEVDQNEDLPINVKSKSSRKFKKVTPLYSATSFDVIMISENNNIINNITVECEQLNC